ncbi:MAG: phosphatidylserine decarboxylase family protein [Syntrophus sp. (in: bacteria)]|nr:phosphatidylserine decarboxylase family protein [Syntrophus sp. (in: bacteria)]
MDQEKGLRETLIAREGLWLIIPSLFLSVFFFAVHIPIASIIFFLFFLFFLFFYRNPKRYSPHIISALLSPADGKVMEIGDIIDREFLDGERKRIAIFMSPFNVHVNRAPCEGVVARVEHRDGEFAAAFKKEVDQVNERNYILLEQGDEKVLMVQIAGFLARRITCYMKEGDRVKPGQPVGIISFGSRVDLYLPKGYEPMVQLNEKVKAGVTVLAKRRG